MENLGAIYPDGGKLLDFLDSHFRSNKKVTDPFSFEAPGPREIIVFSNGSINTAEGRIRGNGVDLLVISPKGHVSAWRMAVIQDFFTRALGFEPIVAHACAARGAPRHSVRLSFWTDEGFVEIQDDGEPRSGRTRAVNARPGVRGYRDENGIVRILLEKSFLDRSGCQDAARRSESMERELSAAWKQVAGIAAPEREMEFDPVPF